MEVKYLTRTPYVVHKHRWARDVGRRDWRANVVFLFFVCFIDDTAFPTEKMAIGMGV